MYRKFKHGHGVQAPYPNHKSDTNQPEKASEHANPEVEKTVAECWNAVLKSCSGPLTKKSKNEKVQSQGAADFGGWRTVRIFVSSTFIDFFSEREVLVKRVFPELRDWCYERRLRLIECDLRWGVPKDATTTQALVTCLEEIDRCFEDNGLPFFLNLLGERYGWIPGPTDVPDDVKEKYDWISNTSITFMEILHGALRCQNSNAAFFLRDPSFLDKIPEALAGRFKSESPLAQKHMKVLKSYLTDHYAAQVFPYTADYKGVSTATGREQVELCGLDKFADQVKEFFMAAIEMTYPPMDNDKTVSPEEAERRLQWTFVLDKAESVQVQRRELQMLLDYCHGTEGVLEKISGKESSILTKKINSFEKDVDVPEQVNVTELNRGWMGQDLIAGSVSLWVGIMEDWDQEDDDNLLCVVTAEGGWGKTSLLAQVVQKMVEEKKDVFYHFVGSTANSGFYSHLVHRLLLALSLDPTDPQLEVALDSDLTKLKELLRKALSTWRTSGRELLIVIDGVNQLDNSNTVMHLSWLPPTLPKGLRCMVSSNSSHLPTTARLFEHPASHLALSTWDAADLQNIAIHYLGRFAKKLDSQQLQKLMQKTKVDNPLWMVLMCEELRVFGDFRTMDQKLQNMPDKMDSFLSSFVQRLISEDDSGYVKKVLYLMACSSNGLPVSHILRLLGDIENKIECPPLYWAQVRVVLKAYTCLIKDGNDREEYFTFIHESMWKAVKMVQEASQDFDVRVWHKQISDVYQNRCESRILRTKYLALHLQQAGLRLRLNEFIRKDPDAMDITPFVRSRFLNDQRCRQTSDAVMPQTLELVLCRLCYFRKGGFNPAAYMPNKDTCCMCSSVTFNNMRHPARVCMLHSMKRRRGADFSLCCVCGTSIFMKDIETSRNAGHMAQLGPAYLCQHCGFGIFGKMCCDFQNLD